MDEVPEQGQALFAVVDLRMELNAPGRLVLEGETGKLDVLRAAGDARAPSGPLNGVPMAHPHLLPYSHTGEEAVRGVDVGQVRATVFTAVTRLHAAPSILGEPLGAEAHPEHRPLGTDPIEVGGGCISIPHAVGATRKDDTLPVPALRVVLRGGLEQGTPVAVPGLDFRKSVQLPDPAGNELGVLGTEVEYEDAVHMCPVSRRNYKRGTAPQGERTRHSGVVLHHA